MSASRKILPRHSEKAKRHGNRKDAKTARGAENDEAEKEILFLRKENEKFRQLVVFWRSQCEQESAGEEEDHWRRRYALRDAEAQKLEGQVALQQKEIAELRKKIEKQNAHILNLQNAAFGGGSEKGPLDGGKEASSHEDQPQPAPSDSPKPESQQACSKKKKKKKRGGQKGSRPTGPKGHDDLPYGDPETYDLPNSACEDCGEQWGDVTNCETEQVEIEVRAYKRKIRRKKQGHHCKAKDGRWVTRKAPAPKRLFPHSSYGISVWVFLLVGKFIIHLPANRVRLLLAEHHLKIPASTIAAGFKRIHKLIKPLITEIRRYSREEKHHWHIDDTGWKVFVKLDGKKGFGWYLWVFLSDDVCVYILSPSRAREVPQSHLKDSTGVVTCDRLPANMKLGEFIIYSFCWVHERRELRELARAYPGIASICHFFLDLIGSLFHHNKARLLGEPDSAQYKEAEGKLEETLVTILENCRKYLEMPDLHEELRRVFNGIVKDWDGFRLFFDLPFVPPDNNPAEQAIRGPVVGRKGYYGSGSQWSADFTAAMFSLCKTLELNKVNPTAFLTEYLQACADNDGKPPPDAAKFLPWHRRPPPPD